MDPLSIAASTTALVTLCYKVTLSLKKFRDEVQTVDAKVKGLLVEVENFTQTMHFMQETLQDSQVHHALTLTGHIGNHWQSMSVCINDGIRTLESLHATIEGVNKNVRFLDSLRKTHRLKEADLVITMYQQQIRSYRDTIYLSIQTTILWNQISSQESTSRIVPRLDELSTMVRRLGTKMNKRITTLEKMVESPSREQQLRQMQNMRSCIQTAAYVVSSASTSLGASDTSHTTPVIAPSDFADLFPPQKNEMTERWISEVSRAFPGSAQPSSPGLPNIAETTVGAGGFLEDSDAEAELELEAQYVQYQLQIGKKELQCGNSIAAEKYLKPGMSRLKTHTSRYLGVEQKLAILQELLDTYDTGGHRHDVKKIRMERIALLSEGSGTPGYSERYLEEIFKLAELLLQLGEFGEAQSSARKCIKGYRKLGVEGETGFRNSLGLMIAACKYQGNETEAEIYAAMLADSRKPVQKEVQEGNGYRPQSQAIIQPDEETEGNFWSHKEVRKNMPPNFKIQSLPHLRVKNLPESYPESYEISPPVDDNDPLHMVNKYYASRALPDTPARSPLSQNSLETLRAPESRINQYSGDTPIQQRPQTSHSTMTVPSISIQPTSSQGVDDSMTSIGVLGEPREPARLTTKQSKERLTGHEAPHDVYKERDLNMLDTFLKPASSLVSEHRSILSPYQERFLSLDVGSGNSSSKTNASLELFTKAPTITAHPSDGSRRVKLRFIQHANLGSFITRRWLMGNQPEDAGNEFVTLKINAVYGTRDGSPSSKIPMSLMIDFMVVDDEFISFDAILGRGVYIPEGNPQLRDPIRQHRPAKSDSWLSTLNSPQLEEDPRRSLGSLTSATAVLEKYQRSTASLDVPLPRTRSRLDNLVDNVQGVRKTQSPVPLPRVTTVFIGPSCCGKTSLIHQYLDKGLQEVEQNNGLMEHTTVVDGLDSPQAEDGVDMVIWDTPGGLYDLRDLEPVQNVNCVVLCYSVDYPESIPDIESLWIQEIKKNYPGRPVLLAALRADLRKDTNTIESLAAVGDQPSSTGEGKRIMERIGAVNYFECSTRTGEGIGNLFQEIALRGLESKQEPRQNRRFWHFSRRSSRSRGRDA